MYIRISMSMAVASTATLPLALRLESSEPNGGVPAPPRLSLIKPTWVVRTESNVRRERMKKPNPPCVICQGSGRVDCQYCNGRGRTNYVHFEMLPKGEWPRWCRTCGGSGLGYCSRCLGSGEYRVQQTDCFIVSTRIQILICKELVEAWISRQVSTRKPQHIQVGSTAPFRWFP